MNLTINGKDYTLNFGIKFIREVDKQTETVTNGIKFSTGLNPILSQLVQGSITALADIIKYATITNTSRPSADEIDEYIDSLSADEYDTLVENVLEAIKESNAGRKAFLAVKKEEAKQAEMQAKMMEKLL